MPSAYGCTRSSNPAQIEIDEETVGRFRELALWFGRGKNARGQNVFIVGVTLLHELCHVGNFLAAKDEATEAGAAYRAATYGKIIP